MRTRVTSLLPNDNLTRRHSSPGNQSPTDCERMKAVAQLFVH